MLTNLCANMLTKYLMRGTKPDRVECSSQFITHSCMCIHAFVIQCKHTLDAAGRSTNEEIDQNSALQQQRVLLRSAVLRGVYILGMDTAR